jgi:integrase
VPLQTIDTTLALKVLESIWAIKPETASRLRGRIESVLDWATVRGYRTGENPARWRGHLDKLLPARSKVRTVKHHAALPYVELPAFMQALHAQAGVGARAFEFTILTAARTGETIGATWKEINRAEKYWTVPGARMKAGKDHRVPLCDRALAILNAIRPADSRQYCEYRRAVHFFYWKSRPTAQQYGISYAAASDGSQRSDHAWFQI